MVCRALQIKNSISEDGEPQAGLPLHESMPASYIRKAMKHRRAVSRNNSQQGEGALIGCQVAKGWGPGMLERSLEDSPSASTAVHCLDLQRKIIHPSQCFAAIYTLTHLSLQ